jgi:IS5 family transposase
MIEMRRNQLSFGDGLIAEEVSDLRENWMRHADAVLADEEIVTIAYEALGKRHPKSRSRGRRGVAAETVLRLLILKHVRNWSYQTLEREVRANLVYRDFSRVGASKMPDAKTMGRWGVAVGPQALKQIHGRIVKIAAEKGVTEGRRMRVDTTVVETNIHHPTDSTLLGDGVRVLTRTMKKITEIAGAVGTQLCDRNRSVKFRLLEIGRVARAKGATNWDKLTERYTQLLNTTSRVVGQAKRFSAEIVQGVKQATTITKQLALEGLRHELDEMVPLVKQVMKQTRDRIFRGNKRSEGKLVSVFEPSTEIIRKGKASKPTEFGKMVKLQEAENQIITDYEVYAQRPYDSDLLIPAIRPCWDAYRAWLRRMLHSIPDAMRLLQRPRASSVFAFPIVRPKVLIANASRKSDGSVRARSGAPDVKGASVSSNGEMASAVAATRGRSECIAGLASASSPTPSSTSVARWKRRRGLKQAPDHHRIFKPAGHPRRVLRCLALLTTTPTTSILRRKVV